MKELAFIIGKYHVFRDQSSEPARLVKSLTKMADSSQQWSRWNLITGK